MGTDRHGEVDVTMDQRINSGVQQYSVNLACFKGRNIGSGIVVNFDLAIEPNVGW
jgi:hypothetical protein